MASTRLLNSTNLLIPFRERPRDMSEQTCRSQSSMDMSLRNVQESCNPRATAALTASTVGRSESMCRITEFGKLLPPPPITSMETSLASSRGTTSVNAHKGNAKLLDYTSTKGAIVGFTRGLALQLVEKGIRVKGVVPGPIWTPLIPASFTEEKTKNFGMQVLMKRAGQQIEVAPCFVFLVSNSCSSYITGQVLHPNGGAIVNA